MRRHFRQNFQTRNFVVLYFDSSKSIEPVADSAVARSLDDQRKIANFTKTNLTVLTQCRSSNNKSWKSKSKSKVEDDDMSVETKAKIDDVRRIKIQYLLENGSACDLLRGM